jgi:hypothetical protein
MRAVNFARKLRVKSAISAKISKNHEHWKSYYENVVAVGTEITPSPPHKSQRAELLHWVPALSSDAQTVPGIRGHNSRFWQPTVNDWIHTLPCHTAFLAPSLKSSAPKPSHLAPKYIQHFICQRYTIITIPSI